MFLHHKDKKLNIIQFKNRMFNSLTIILENSTFPPCIFSREASYGIYLPSVMNQSQGMIFCWNQDFSGKLVVVGVCVWGSAYNHSWAWKILFEIKCHPEIEVMTEGRYTP